jgi:hypothetical protein
MLGDWRVDLESITRGEPRIRPAHLLECTGLGAQLLRSAQIQDGGLGHEGRGDLRNRSADGFTAPEYVPDTVGSTGCATHRAERPPTPVPAGGLSCGPGEAAHNAPMPTPEPARHDTVEDEEDRPRPVAGTVRLMTEDPFEIDDDADSGLGSRLSSIASKSPWVIPAVLVGIGVAFLVLRRRR